MLLKNKSIVKRVIHDSVFLIDISANYANDKCYLYQLDAIGCFIWDCLTDTGEISAIVEQILSVTTGLETDVVYHDVAEFIEMLLAEKFLEVLDG